MDTYLDARLTADDPSSALTVDVCGVKNGILTAVFCQTAGLDELLAKSIETNQRSQKCKRGKFFCRGNWISPL